MSQLSKIEWTDATWSPVVGCTRVSAGCDHCYAVRQTRRLEAMGQEKYAGLVNAGKGHFNGTARLHAPSLDWPLRWRGAKAAKQAGRSSRVFVNPMSDLFHESLSDEAIAAVFGVMAACPQHTFQVLTKRPERMLRWFKWAASEMKSDAAMLLEDATSALALTVSGLAKFYDRARGASWPLPNVWLGVSVEDQATANERIPLLLRTPAARRFVSYEPALAAVAFHRIPADGAFVSALHGARPGWPALDWLIVGGESGPGARPFELAWARSAIAQCREAGVPCFYKQGGASNRCAHDAKGGHFDCFPPDLQVREFPNE